MGIALAGFLGRLITRARRGDLAARRIVSAYVRSEDVARKLMEDIAPRFATRPGGYTRIYRLGPRPGDAGQMGILELVERKIVKPAPKRDGTKKKTKGEVETAGDEGEEEAGGKAVKGKAAGKKAAATKPEKGKPEKAGEKSEAAEKRRALRDRKSVV